MAFMVPRIHSGSILRAFRRKWGGLTNPPSRTPISHSKTLRSLVIAALLVYGISILGAIIAPRPVSGDPTPTRPTPRQGPPPQWPLRGFAISLHHTNRLDLYLASIDEIAKLGFNCLEVATPAFQTHGASAQIQLVTGPGRGPTRQQLVTLLQHAHDRGLTTALMPQILFTDPRGNEWRGKIHPPQWGPWWESYARVTDYFLDVANEADVDIYCVGSELLSTERQADRWDGLIDHVRSRFKGWLTYSTNWDHYHVPTIWRRLDMIGVSGYWDLTEQAQHDPPTHDELRHRWQGIRQQLLAFAQDQGRPILFTEIGYPSLTWALKDPWNYVPPDPSTPPDPQAQALGYEAFLNAWGDLLVDRPQPQQLVGVFFYAWDPYRQGGPGDYGYGVRGKPALQRLRQWLEAAP